MNAFLRRRSRGFTLLELVIYLGFTAVLAAATFGFLGDVLRTARKTGATDDAAHAVRLAEARLLHETRAADAIVDASSVFSSDDGRLALSSGSATQEFFLSAGRALMVKDASGATSALTPSGVRVRVFRIEPVAVTASGSPRSLRFTIETEQSVAGRPETGAVVRAAFAASLR